MELLAIVKAERGIVRFRAHAESSVAEEAEGGVSNSKANKVETKWSRLNRGRGGRR